MVLTFSCTRAKEVNRLTYLQWLSPAQYSEGEEIFFAIAQSIHTTLRPLVPASIQPRAELEAA
jgi:hypothetical protein